ncbi:alginate export family protein [Spongiivirga citrea]|uniref:Alginate export family protein n=1 Tax=Spongiivirga citrea TaxID=1481457 RepID=A0A6M0CSW9_9FLAO|nr:alginate export family protein [Spongiivirga citrea]NER16930.1 alginate export family protein [Spongiivirga citrea]
MKTQLQLVLCLLFALSSINCFAQLKIDADIRPRFEYRHGFGNLFPDNAEPAAFVTQRTRLNIKYGLENLSLMVAVQDVSTWGDTRQILPVDGNDSFSLFQAWAELKLDEFWSTKLGRQIISYDDQRIFGGLDWAMQGRFHDAALIKYEKDKFKAHFGFAFSQQTAGQTEGTGFDITGFFTYKAMQYAYLKKQWEKSSASFLFLNTGFQKFTGINDDIPDGTFYRHTAGGFYSFPIGSIKMNGFAYYQFGKANANTDLSSYDVSLEAIYKPQKTVFGLGFELLSGTDQGSTGDNKSFFPLYGTNHKFNGFMDYFYVGNHANNVGLNDIYAKAVFKTGERSTLLVKGHYFLANAELANNANSYLGTEIDIVFTQKELIKNVVLNLGYSHMFAGDSMSLIKGGRPNNNTNNWAWARLLIRPTLFTSTSN